MTTSSHRDRTLRPHPVDPDRKRSAQAIDLERDLPFQPTTATPHRVTVTFLAEQLRRLRTRLAHLTVPRRTGSPARR